MVREIKRRSWSRVIVIRGVDGRKKLEPAKAK
jgi:hypothetical protein